MSQCSQFAPKEHTDLLHLPNLDIYCNLSEMIINFFETTLLLQCVLISSLSHQDSWLGGVCSGVECLSLCQLSIVTSTRPDPGLSRSQPLVIVELADPYLTQCYLSTLNAATSG